MTLKERYEEIVNDARIEKFEEILEFVSSKLKGYHTLFLEIYPRNIEVVVGDFDNNFKCHFNMRKIEKIFDFNSEEGIREFKNELLFYFYMNLKDVMMQTDNLYKHQICVLY